MSAASSLSLSLSFVHSSIVAPSQQLRIAAAPRLGLGLPPPPRQSFSVEAKVRSRREDRVARHSRIRKRVSPVKPSCDFLFLDNCFAFEPNAVVGYARKLAFLISAGSLISFAFCAWLRWACLNFFPDFKKIVEIWNWGDSCRTQIGVWFLVYCYSSTSTCVKVSVLRLVLGSFDVSELVKWG